MKHKFLILMLAAYSAIGADTNGTIQQKIIPTTQFAREISTNETAAQWRAKLGVDTNGVSSQTNWALSSITNANNLTNWSLLPTNLLSSGTIQTQISYVDVTNAPWQRGSLNLTNWGQISTNVLTNYVLAGSISTNTYTVWGLATNKSVTTTFPGSVSQGYTNGVLGTYTASSNEMIRLDWYTAYADLLSTPSGSYSDNHMKFGATASPIEGTNRMIAFSEDVFSDHDYVNPVNDRYVSKSGSVVIQLQAGSTLTVTNSIFINTPTPPNPSTPSVLYQSFSLYRPLTLAITSGVGGAASSTNFYNATNATVAVTGAGGSASTNGNGFVTITIPGGGGGETNYVDLLVSTNFHQVRATNSGRVTITLHATNLPGANVTGIVPNATTSGFVTNATLTNNISGSAATATNYLGALSSTNKNYYAQQALYFTNVTAGGYIQATTAGAGYPGMFGFTFKPRTNITVTHISRWIVSGNTQKHDLVIVRTNDSALIAHTQIDTSRFSNFTNQEVYIELTEPVGLDGNDWYFVGSGEYTGVGGDNFPQNSGAWSTGWQSNSCIQFGFGCPEGYFPIGFSGWPNITYAVNFKFVETPSATLAILRDGTLPNTENTLVAKKTFPGIVKADSFEGSAMDLTATPAVIDLGPFTEGGGPTMGIDGYGVYYGSTNGFGNGGLPNITDVIRFSHALRTNGMSQNYSVYLLDDGWYYTVNRTNGNRIVDFEQLQISGHPRYIADAYFVRSNGVLQADPVNFPGGLEQAIHIMRTNGLQYRHYMPFRTNLNEFALDVDYATKAGASEMMLDTTVGRQPNYLTVNTIDNFRKLIRTFQYATIRARADGRAYPWTNDNFHMQLHGGAHANAGADHMNYPTNKVFTSDHINGMTGYIFNGSDAFTLSNVVDKARSSWPYRRFFRRGHYPDFLLTTWDSQSTNTMRSVFNTYMMSAGSWLINPGAITDRLGAEQHILTNREFYVYAQDPSVIQGYSIWSNSLKEIWWRPIGSTNSGTNLAAFLNLTTTNYTHTLNVTNFGGVSNQTYYVRDIWFKTNTTMIDQFTFVSPPTNNHVFAVWKPQLITNYYSPGDLNVAGTQTSRLSSSSPSAAPHYINDAWQQSAASAAAFTFGIGIEPDVESVNITYLWVSGLSSGTAHWVDQWQTWYNSPVGRDGIAPQTFTTNILCVNGALLETVITIPMPATNAWKQLNFSAAASTNGNARTMPFGLKVVKVKP